MEIPQEQHTRIIAVAGGEMLISTQTVIYNFAKLHFRYVNL